jgi:hypothetical protein
MIVLTFAGGRCAQEETDGRGTYLGGVISYHDVTREQGRLGVARAPARDSALCIRYTIKDDRATRIEGYFHVLVDRAPVRTLKPQPLSL